MKKIISIVAALAMLMSTSVLAVVPEGCTAPKATVTCEKTAGPDSDGYYDYELKINLSDMGKLYHTGSRKISGDKLRSVSIDLRADKAMEVGKTSVSGTLGNAAVFSNTKDYTGSDASGINITYYCSEAGSAYPTSGETTSADGAIVLKFYAKQGTITLSNGVIGFLKFTDGVIDGAADELPLTLDKTSFTIGEATKPETIGVDATLLVSNDVAQEGITTNGYIWKVDLTNAAAISDFKATFQKAGEKDAERKIRNMQALTDAMGGKGTYSFNVGLNTKKTGVTAKFEVTDGTNTAVWPAE